MKWQQESRRLTDPVPGTSAERYSIGSHYRRADAIPKFQLLWRWSSAKLLRRIANYVTSTRLTYARNCNDWIDVLIPARELRREMQNPARASRGHGFRRRTRAPSAQSGSRRSLTPLQSCLSKTLVATQSMNTSARESRAVLSTFSRLSQNCESWPRARYCVTGAEE